MLGRTLRGVPGAAGFLFAGGLCVSYPKLRGSRRAPRSCIGEISGCYLGNLEAPGFGRQGTDAAQVPANIISSPSQDLAKERVSRRRGRLSQ
jgi:hypothetical protein